MRGGGGLIALGETEQEKYGNNLNDLLSRFGIEVANCTVQDYEHYRLGPVLGAGRARERVERRAREGRPPRPRPPGLLLSRRDPGAPQRRPRDRPHLAQRLAAAGAPRRDHRARRRPRRGARRLRPVRRRLHRRARQRVAVAEPRLLGGAAGLRRRAGRDRLAGPLRSELGRAQGGRRGAAADPGARRLGRPVQARRRAASPSWSGRSRAPPAAWRATSPIRRTTSRPCATTCAPGSTPTSPSPTSFARSRRSGRSATGATGSSTWPCSRCTSRTRPATPASRR